MPLSDYEHVYYPHGMPAVKPRWLQQREGLERQGNTKDHRDFYTNKEGHLVHVVRGTYCSFKPHAFYYHVFDGTDEFGFGFMRRAYCDPKDVYLAGTTTCVLDVPDPVELLNKSLRTDSKSDHFEVGYDPKISKPDTGDSEFLLKVFGSMH